VTVLDASAVIAFLRGEPGAPEVRVLMQEGDATLTATGLAEVVDHLVRVAEVPEAEALADLAQLGLVDAMPIDAMLGVHAGRLRARRYHRVRCAVSLADCLAASAARQRDEPLATSDPALLDACHAEGIAHLALPGSDGTRWEPPASG
jgi:PIN domain nuclease of toxin-antitoxin system